MICALPLALGVILALLPRREKKAPLWLSWAFALACPVYGYLAGEMIFARYERAYGLLTRWFASNILTPRYVLLNLLFISLLCLFFTALTGSIKVGPLAGILFHVFFGIVNYYVYTFRGAAITFTDLASAGTALEVAGSYTPKLTGEIYRTICYMTLPWMAAFRLPGRGLMRQGWKRYLLGLTGGLAVAALCLRLLVFSPFLEDIGIRISYYDTRKSYVHRGLALNFARSVWSGMLHAPEGYSLERVEALAKEYLEEDKESPEAEELVVSEKNPNILVIIDEAFADLRTLGIFETDVKPIPFLKSLKKDGTRHGTNFCSSFGGRTANTELEFLTGLSMAVFPVDSIPLQLYIRNPLPSLATYLKERGYAGIVGMHPYKAKNYNRNRAYPLLGFTESYFLENAPLPLTMVRRFASDASTFANLRYLYQKTREETKAPWFGYTMTVQNHSSYSRKGLESSVHLLGLSKEYPEVEQYLTLEHLTDEAMEEMISFFEETGEPTVVVFFGDHQPQLPRGFIKEISKDRKYSYAFMKKYSEYAVPYFIWSNFPLEGETQVYTSTNYQQINLLNALGMELTPFQRFLADLQEEVPVLNAFGYQGADGKCYLHGDESSPYYEKVQDYFCLCYNYLCGGKHRLEEFFTGKAGQQP